ncbi:MAG: hypothetical protein NVS4B3_01010 [Gemmatimonadaceae bacterium]
MSAAAPGPKVASLVGEAFSLTEISPMRTGLIAMAVVGAATLAACEKTGDNTYEVKRPVLGVRTDTVRTPSVDVVKERDTITTPRVTSQKTEVVVPKVRVKTP